MKFMKLGSRPDIFYTKDSVRSVSSEVSSDLIIQVKGTRYLLHKFPLLSKCLHLQRLCLESLDSGNHQIVQLPDFPGGEEAFELCAKFCYGITITLSAYNIVSTRCAAEYLQMTEDAEKGNLIYKLEVFFNSCILRGWKDSVVTLQTTKALSLWSEELSITNRCIEAICSKVLKRVRNEDDISCSGTESLRDKSVRKGWWGEDLAELKIDLYWRIMIALKSDGKMPLNLIGDALKIYASRWLPKTGSDSDSRSEIASKYSLLLESIVNLLPAAKGVVSCSFLLKLLKVANDLKVFSSLKIELVKRVGLQFEEVTVNDLIMVCDVDLVMNILEEFMLQISQSPPTSPQRSRFAFERRRSRSAENVDFELQESRRSSSVSHSSKLKVAKLVDKYLQEVAKDVNLPLDKFVAIAETVPEFARCDHDDLYSAIDTYLKAHPELDKTERKRLCRILDCKKLSISSCMHAAQNELLPLRLVVQVLFFEQARAASSGGKVTNISSNIKALLTSYGIDPSKHAAQLSTSTSIHASDNWSVNGLNSPKNTTLRMKLAEDDFDENNDVEINGIGRSSRFKSFCSLPTKPKRMFSKLWSTNRSTTQKN
ncbi:putative SKP1/BTB/POZ domain, NPH3 domain-containing protein [Medicago truncatula]|uniref:Phototropic-responsive NPH3 family protein n=1 Tax=Medicago truncatula TaxID=3880 RepID=G7LJB7_MEDTR|nr:BTB/POZ domain-containing protein At1g67900 [Medicago truncatula]AET03413.2 phototropic-responsive NPH3 family protein [Medicago truncatula]RHN41609.1 putative SKP1/BTB/POZ domain, NPH3 domain-containing protein [Medicago truncatula]